MKWHVRNFRQKHKLQYLKNFTMESRDFKFSMQ